MKKTYIIGIVGSGKSTLARKLSKDLGINHYEVDAIAYKIVGGERLKQTLEQQIQAFKTINEEDSWIIEGTYRPSCAYVLEEADRIVFLDPPLWLRRYRIIKRFIKQNLKLEKCHYKPDLEMLRAMFEWTNTFEDNRKVFEEMLSKYQEKLIVIKSNKACKAFK